MFWILDEYSSGGRDPRTHADWKLFLSDLKKEHSEDAAGILVLANYASGMQEVDSFSMMIIPKDSNSPDVIVYWKELFSEHKGKTIIDFVEL
jgi:hypothetical protein